MAKRFTLPEAERLLPEIESEIRSAIELKARYQQAEGEHQAFNQRLMLSGGMAVDRDAILAKRAAKDKTAEELKSAIDAIHGFGCQVKDLDIGLIDFPTLYQGREVYLCWKLGEKGISFWHGVDEGFQGRKPVDHDFLENHRGDAPN